MIEKVVDIYDIRSKCLLSPYLRGF